MSSRRILTFSAMVVWAAVAVTAAPRAFSHHRSTAMIAAAADSNGFSCSDFRPTFHHHDAVYQSEDRAISRSEAPILDVQADANGGLFVEGWEKENYSVTLCKAAEAGTSAEAVLSGIHLSFNGGHLSVSGPSNRDGWAAHILIRAPKAAALELHVQNGPVTLAHVDGNLKVQAQNGPVTVTGCTGELDLSAQNGPVTLEDNSGQQKIRAENGPISLSLSGNAWSGAGIEASSTNGPVTLHVPSGYQSGVLLEAEGHSPFLCSSNVCSEGRKTWEEDHRRVEFGSGPTLVHVSTANGPVSVL